MLLILRIPRWRFCGDVLRALPDRDAAALTALREGVAAQAAIFVVSRAMSAFVVRWRAAATSCMGQGGAGRRGGVRMFVLNLGGSLSCVWHAYACISPVLLRDGAVAAVAILMYLRSSNASAA
jgi:hypothetical protein